MTNTRSNTFVNQGRRLLASAALAATALGGIGLATAPKAEAINPAQTTAHGVFNWLAYQNVNKSIPAFWKWVYPNYTVPTTYQYNRNLVTACGSMSVNNSFYCPANNSLYLSTPWNQTWVNSFGDYAAGGIAAHEFGHSVASYLRRSSGTYRDEYFADCLTGVYTRYGYDVGRLVGSDYSEMWNWLNTRAYSSSHGSGPNRAAWYRYGYQTYSIGSCLQVYGTTAATASVSAASYSQRSRYEPHAEAVQSRTLVYRTVEVPDHLAAARDDLKPRTRAVVGVDGIERPSVKAR